MTAKKAPKELSYQEKHLGLLIGKTVTGLVRDREYQECYGLRFTDGTVAWIMCDPEGNGPGHLDITDEKGNTLAP